MKKIFVSMLVFMLMVFGHTAQAGSADGKWRIKVSTPQQFTMPVTVEDGKITNVGRFGTSKVTAWNQRSVSGDRITVKFVFRSRNCRDGSTGNLVFDTSKKAGTYNYTCLHRNGQTIKSSARARS